MAEDLIRYDILAQDALRGVLRKVLSEVAKTGLPGEHHFYITFATRGAGVRISSRVLNQYPEDMTIVLQHQFWDLTVSDHALEVGLSFNGVPERLLIPFSAIKAFVDPSVQFALQFEPAMEETDGEAVDGEPTDAKATDDNSGTTATIVPAPRPAEPVKAENSADAAETEPAVGDDAEAEAEEPRDAEVVSLDAFRKKS